MKTTSRFPEITLKARKGIKNSTFKMVSLAPPDSIYFMGICGTALSSLAVLLKSHGFFVSGSDKNIYPPMSTLLQEREIALKNYNPCNLNSSIKLVIVGNVISKNHSEVSALEKLFIPYISFSEFLEGAFLSEKKNIVVAGTHGKTTTTSLTAHVAREAGKNPGFFIGGRPKDFKVSFRHTDSKWFVIEGDEYDTAFFAKWPKFFHYNPFVLILTGVEWDHRDIYKNFQAILKVFSDLVARVPKEGFIVACIENKGVQRILKTSKIKARVITCGVNRGDFQIKNPRMEGSKSHFEVCCNKKNYPLSLNLLGEHNMLNALSVFALAVNLKWPLEKTLKAFDSFKGVKKRLERVGEIGGILLMEDFAHHPTAVKMTLEGLKRAFPHRRLTAVFEPRSFTSCLNVFQRDYAKALSVAERVFLTKPFRVMGKGKGLNSQKLAADIQALGREAFFNENTKALAHKLLSSVQPGDIILVMSNGDFDNLSDRLKRGLKERFS